MTFQSRKNQYWTVFLKETRGFIYKKEVKKWLKKLSDLLDEGKT